MVGCRLEDDERDDREVVLEPRARHPPCCDASECLFSRKPSRAAGEFLYQSGTLSRCNDRCTLSSCSLGTRSPTFCSSFSGGCNDKFMFVFFSSSSMDNYESSHDKLKEIFLAHVSSEMKMSIIIEKSPTES